MSRFIVWLRLIAVVWLSCGVYQGPVVNVRAEKTVSKKEGLYSVQDDVIILNRENMKNRVHGKSMVWVIEFYNSWCGHCIQFAPTWRQFASDLKGWRRVVSVGAVDCASGENLEVCREYDIQAYPSIRLIPPNFDGNMVKGKLTKLDTQDKLEMKYAVLEYVTDPQFPVPPSWPRLKPLKTLGDIWEEANDDHKFVVVVFEDTQSVVGREVILDLLDYPSILVRTMLKKDVEKFGILKYPSLYIINKDSSFQHLASGTGLVDSDRHRFVDKLLSMMGFFDSQGRRIKIPAHPDNAAGGEGGQMVQFQEARDGRPAKVLTVKQQIAKERDGQSVSMGVHMRDLESAVHYALRQEVAICKTIVGPRLDALRNFVSALAKYFPGRAEVLRFLWKVNEYLEEVGKSLTGESWMRALDNLQDKEAFLPYEIRWAGCQGSHPRYRGYPCGMWTLFHTLTVAAYEKTSVNALEVPLAIRGYMEHFFGCHECSKNFLKMATTLEQEIHKPLDAVMWLWAAHNKANKRLHGDASEDPDHPKIQFPSAQDCPKCRTEQTLDSYQVPQWNSSAVMLFLLKIYSKDSIVQDASASTWEMTGSRTDNKDEEMDWWEKQQRQVDLKKIREFREQKRKKKQGEFVLGEVAVEREVAGFEHRGKVVRRVGSKLEEGSLKFGPLHSGWGLSQLDIGVCMVFYVICAAIIVVLYYHFIVQKRFRMPCSKYLPV